MELLDLRPLTAHSCRRNIMATLSPRLSGICLVALLAVLAACGGGGSGNGSGIATGSGTASGTGSNDSGGPSTGSLAVSVTGLPAGLNGAIVVSGPGGFSQTVLATQTAIILVPGTYTITADNVLSGSGVFAPQSTIQTIAVNAGATANAAVIYASAGALRLALQEIVSGLANPLFLTAPSGDPRCSQRLSWTSAPGLPPGANVACCPWRLIRNS
jgi:hypothetical protein